MFEPLGKLIKKSTARFSFSKEIVAVSVFNAVNKVLEKDFGQNLIKPLSFRDGVLSLKTSNPIISQEIQSRSQEIIDSINKELGDRMVLRIVFR